MSHAPTLEQAEIRDFVKANPTSSLVVRARAGTGKTTTITDHIVPVLTGESLILAYNKSIQMELTKRLPAIYAFTCSVATCHSFGLGILRSANRRLKVEGGKLHFLFRNILKSKPSFNNLFNSRQAGASAIVNLVSHAKNSGFGLPLPGYPAIEDVDAWFNLIDHFNMDSDFLGAGLQLPAVVEMAQYLLTHSNRTTDTVDFDDMIYFPLLFDLPIPQKNHVIIDEAQDISTTRFELAYRATLTKGRLIAVGDEKQAIYGFTGADANAMPNIISRTNAAVLPLTICWRCDANIITAAQALVPDIVAKPNAPAGTVDRLDIYKFLESDIPLGSAILCRLNRPNISVALSLLSREIPVRIEGKDIGRNLLKHMKDACPLYATASGFELINDLETFREVRTGELMSRNKAAAAALFQDEVDGAILLIERTITNHGGDVANFFAQVEALVTTLFADNIPPGKLITLSSVHKAKGREWPRVYALGASDYMPFWMAEMDWEIEQENNLIYVLITRAAHHLTYIDGVKQWLDDKQA